MKDKSQERRKYIRLDSVFPVQFRLVNSDGNRFISDWLQGFTSNIGKGGMCLSVNRLDAQLARILKERQAKLALNIEIPLNRKPVPAQASVAWIREAADEPNRCLIGLSYDDIDKGQNAMMMHYAWLKKLFMPVALSLIIILGAGFAFNTFISIKLIKGNKLLVEQLLNIVQESSLAKQKVKTISKEREDLQLKIKALELRIKIIEEEKTKMEAEKSAEISRADKVMNGLIQEKASLQESFIAVQQKENVITEELLRLDKRKAQLEKANLDKMYQWLKIHQSPRTGLTMSFEGDNDIANWAFTYDQSLLIHTYVYFSDFERARKIMDFFRRKARKQDGLFLNAYYVNDGSPAEYTAHSGPSIWLGIAVIQYIKKTGDFTYLGLAEDIAKAILELQEQGLDGGIRGNKSIEWYSTEHNLDAYAFFNMLYAVTNKEKYLIAQDKALNWILTHTYDKSDVPIARGKGDSTIATDTYAWSIAAIGPEKLEEAGMNPDRILEFAEQNCSVEATYLRPEGRYVKIKGFDFAAQRHLARGGIVSSEWTAQMILSFKIMADYYYRKNMVAKARAYELKADNYLAELGNLVISSPSPSGQGESCLPYATQDYVDTGHGWITPKGSNTGSVAGTTYMLFAYYKYNPLQFNE